MGKGIKRLISPCALETAVSLEEKGVSEWARRRGYHRVNKGVYLHKSLIGAGQAREGEREDNSTTQLDIITRARAEHLARPDSIIAGWAALAYHGLRYWADEAALSVVSREGRARAAVPRSRTARSENARMTWTWKPDPYHPELRCVDLIEALVSALKSVKSNSMKWNVPAIEGYSAEQIRGIQLLDAVRRIAGQECDVDELVARARGRVNSRWLAKIVRASDDGADSPMETLMRLTIAGIVVCGEKLEWESQVSIMRDGSLETGWEAEIEGRFEPWLTVADLYCAKYKIVLFYDGEHHREKGQHYRDIDIDATLQEHGYLVMRVSAVMVFNPRDLRRRIAVLAESVRYRQEM